ncbi:MAG: polyprenyl synthetase family protein [Bacteroidales bacterium]|jgi:geranylgeranyl diphosphate synthase type II|nr:polyprenyl synthetase family protein [Bacteroidales bacterium]
MTLENIFKNINERIETLDLIREPRELYEPVDYCLKNGGKRMRPAMTLLACQMFGGDLEKAMNPAIGLELFHNFTLMHDDIMDNAPIRRGKPAVHTKWNANTAILSGDVMFALAGKFMMGVENDHLREVMETYHKTVIEVCDGQQLDMNFEKRAKVSLPEYVEMIRLKTAVLPAACLKVGAIVAGAGKDDKEHIYHFGEYIGLAFQLKDDWLDLFSDESKFGKKNGGDILANKKTWLFTKALDLSNAPQRKTLLGAFANKITDPEEKIRTVKDIYLNLEIDHLVIKQMEEYYGQAFSHLAKIKVPESNKENLYALAKNLFDREI